MGHYKNGKRQLVMWLRWPEDAQKTMVPWFVIAWRLPFYLIFYACCSVAWLMVVFSNGPKNANEWWHNAT
jgi:hypothetical protein